MRLRSSGISRKLLQTFITVIRKPLHVMRTAFEPHTKEAQRGAQEKRHETGGHLGKTQKNGTDDVRGRRNVPIGVGRGGGGGATPQTTWSQQVEVWVPFESPQPATLRQSEIFFWGGEEWYQGDPSDRQLGASNVGRNALSGPNSSATRRGRVRGRGHVYPVYKREGGGGGGPGPVVAINPPRD